MTSTKITIADKAINTTYQDKTGTTSGTGTGAKFDVTKTDGVYSVVLDSVAASAGTGYAPGDTITILGSALGGVNTTNDLIITVATVGTGGKIATFGKVGTGRVGDGVVDINVDVTGTAGIDAFSIDGVSTDFSIVNDVDNNDLTVTSGLVSTFHYNLADHERVVFTDKAIAFDTLGTAGDVYAILGAGLGVADITAAFVGAGIYLKDTQGYTNKQLAQALLATTVYQQDAGGTSDETFVKHVWKNVKGTDATLAEVKDVLAFMQAGKYDQADILLMAADLETFQDTIDLVGMATTGIAYTPYAV